MRDKSISLADGVAHQVVCLRNISRYLSDSEREVHDVLNTLAHLLPEGWQYSSDTCVRIVWGEMVTESANFKETQWKQIADVQSGDTVIGTLEIYYLDEKPEAEEGPFLFDERSLLETVAAELGSYLEHKQIQRLKDQQHRELELYASLLRHDLRNDVGVIVGNTEILKMIMPDRDENLDQIITSTEAVCVRMMSLLNVFGRAATISSTNPVTMIKKIAEQTKEINPDMKVQLEIAKEAEGAKIPESKLLPLVFDNILRNAAVHAGQSPEVQISITKENRVLKIIISDDGPGVAEEVRERLFQKGVSTRGGGLGLYLSKHVVETMGGSITLLDSEYGKGAVFEIVLPTIN
ncbi:MAG: HAMP domain-containing histidine kinase [Candidatus Thorarchaeota archaeon]|nr:HAMP domain-containing histidine kinase [Candidatus Thorarchaeota archaeon]